MSADVVLICRPTEEVRDARVVSVSENARVLEVGREQVHGPKDRVRSTVVFVLATSWFGSPTKEIPKIALWLRLRRGPELPGLLWVALKAVDQDNTVVLGLGQRWDEVEARRSNLLSNWCSPPIRQHGQAQCSYGDVRPYHCRIVHCGLGGGRWHFWLTSLASRNPAVHVAQLWLSFGIASAQLRLRPPATLGSLS